MKKFTLIFYGICILIFLYVLISTCNKLNNSWIETFQNNGNLNYTIVMFMTGGICEEAHNCIETLKKINLQDKIKVYTLDKKADKCIKKLNIKTKFNNNINLELSSKIREKGFQQITYEKFNSIEDCLKTTNNIVVYTDCDIVFFKSIEPDIIKFANSDYDMMFQCDNDNFNKDCKYLCTGFMFLKPTKNTFNCLRKAKEIMKEDIKKGHTKLHDQTALNKAIKNINIKYGILDPTEYPNGARYFKSEKVDSAINDVYKNHTPIIIHNNFIVGNDSKKKRFQNNNMWYVGEYSIENFENNELKYPGFYINHPDAKDRKIKLEKHLKSLGLDKSIKQHLVNLKTEPKVTDSHKNILKKAIEMKLPYVIILEDDVEFKENPKPYIDDAFKKLNGDWDILLLGANLKKAKVEHIKDLNLGKLNGGECHGCHSYIVNRRYYNKLLNNMKNGNEGGACIETMYNGKYTSMLELCKKDKWYFINPLLGYQSDNYSFNYNKKLNKDDGRFDHYFK